MTEYPTRPLVFEAFVSQVELIEKTLIEVQNQPASYYGRRNNRPNMGQNTQTHTNAHSYYNKYNNFYQSQQQQQQPSVYGGDYYGGYRNSPRSVIDNSSSQMNQPGVVQVGQVGQVGQSAVTGVSPSGASLGLSLGETQPNMPVVNGSGGLFGPQVFTDRGVFSSQNGKGAFSEQTKKSTGLSTFDPFGIYANEYAQSAAYPPLFNSSNDILGSSFSSNSTNIWGDTNKSVANDAAVWG
ncbi:predicted protein [Clavispora lusitaniae ATCC 42720]|uniref:Uncharacterized protein n=1 Tax=Clavispora lusitaniae (strain ATCC 42720) TaxID=306902 RepID=C4YB26_CLAL4|nr:uncharacterized protein CLUG_05318 [Clavispora lusitaniae ATCC 42720]EEQ41190.1 predicted protein [Clavispora lusitaniae ATCC 42720]